MEFKAKDKYQKMIRVYKKLENINREKIGTASNTEAQDTTEEFFSVCYHLKDWLTKKYPNIKKIIENYVSSTVSLSLAGVYTNSFKHGAHDGHNKSKKIEQINNYFTLTIAPSPKVSTSCIITIDGIEYNSLELATQCVNDWDNFLKDQNINIDNI